MRAHLHSSTIYNQQNMEATQVSVSGWWINKRGSISTMEYYSAVKMNKVLIHCTTQMNLRIVMRSARSHRGERPHPV